MELINDIGVRKLMTHSIRLATELDAKSIGLVHIRSWQKAYEHYIPESILNNLSHSERAQRLAGDRLSVGNDQEQVAGLGIKPRTQLGLKLWREELRSRTCESLGLDFQPDQSLGSKDLD